MQAGLTGSVKGPLNVSIGKRPEGGVEKLWVREASAVGGQLGFDSCQLEIKRRRNCVYERKSTSAFCCDIENAANCINQPLQLSFIP